MNSLDVTLGHPLKGGSPPKQIEIPCAPGPPARAEAEVRPGFLAGAVRQRSTFLYGSQPVPGTIPAQGLTKSDASPVRVVAYPPSRNAIDARILYHCDVHDGSMVKLT